MVRNGLLFTKGERRRERGKTVEEDVLITVVQFGFIYLFDKV